ncbi:MAG: hypothetical protein HY066_03150 [Betaproteobacteria bacterium]|nr:hypothetical protein [Betaproteobacteria bacterium]
MKPPCAGYVRHKRMTIKATHTTAAIAGAWAVFGLVPFEMWMDRYSGGAQLLNNMLWLSAAAVFFLLPGYFLVLGGDNEPFRRTWFLDPEERARYAVITKRMFVWFVSAGAIGSIWSLLLSYIVSKS